MHSWWSWRMVGLAFLVSGLTSCSRLPIPDLPDLRDNLETKTDRVTAGLVTDEMLEAEPYGFRVQWIAWDSAFRDTSLQIGDRIVGVDGERYRRDARSEFAALAIGGHQEASHWERQRAGDGDEVTLLIWRNGETLEVTGELRAERLYHTAEGRAALGPGGPYRLETDGYRSAWARWYEDQVVMAIRVLDGGWQRASFHNRMLLQQHEDERQRVEELVDRYPGPFADAVQQDWERVRDVLRGPERTVTADDLEYRELGERLAAEMAEVARGARQEFLAEHRDAMIDAFPAVDPIEDDPSEVAGKLVALPTLTNRDWFMEAGHPYMAVGDARRGYYFVDVRHPATRRVMDARYQYQRLVGPGLAQSFEIVGRIREEPTMRVVDGDAHIGLMVEVVAAMVDDAMFVEATVVNDSGQSPFAGEEALADPGDIVPADDASPSAVMEALILALKLGNEAAWESLFAPWRVVDYGSGRFAFYPFYWTRSDSEAWIRSRRLILGDVYDVNVVNVGRPRRILDGSQFEGAPVVDRVEVEIEHIGRFHTAFRPFTNASVNRMWLLERVDGGPWRIASRQGI